MAQSRPIPQLCAALVVFLALAPWVRAQPTGPRIGYVFPAGGRQGATFQIAVGGQYLRDATSAYISGGGVRAVFVEFSRPMTQKEFNDGRDKLRELQQKRLAAARNSRKRGGRGGSPSGTNVVWTAADEKMAADLRRRMFLFAPKRNPNPAIAETATFRVTLTDDAEPGERELRLATPTGLSSPLRFWVGQLPEFTKRQTMTVPDEASFRQLRFNNEQKAVAPFEMTITLPAIINGQVLPGGVDRYRFQARKGLQLVVAATARELIPYLPDAVPGWFQAALALYDSKGRELTHADHYLFHPDPVFHYEIPSDGEYVVEIRDSIYRGREDFVYRIAAGELPYLTSVFPLGGSADARTTVELKGWNLPTTSLTLTNGEPGIYPLHAGKDDKIINNLPFAVDNLPERIEQEPNNSAATAQPVTLPIIVNGRIEQSGEWDVFRFTGHAGDAIVAEVYARRLDSPLDSALKLTDAGGKQLAFNDDHEDKGAGLDTHYADAYLTATLPADGTYYIHLGDAQRQAGPEHAYRLRLSAPRPDFALRVVPSSLSVRGGASTPLTVYALRRDGFTNEITLSLPDAPPGFKLNGARIPANQDQVRLTLQPPPTPTDAPIHLVLEGRAFVRGRPLVHSAVPAEDMMQAFAYRHLVPAHEFAVTIAGRFMNRAPLKVLSPTPVKIPAGGTARVRISAPAGGFANRFRLELNEPPEGITLGRVSPGSEVTVLELCSDAAKAKPGQKGNLIVNILPGQAPSASTKNKKKAPAPRAAVGTLPAIPFEITQALNEN
ncbi:MAG TPA: PPC domain-containing protein [Candidatus Paceibacterota bacterium]|nr:PPC domain-containing protein [Verrucomicrobiota bacterium]HSA09208.1 PPC domain-containing protein [Candidatus Paceibacterota bacterium]